MVKILLDNGHGVNTPGKRSPVWEDGRQLLEWEFNRDMVVRVANWLEAKGITHEILVPEERDISITERCQRANRVASKEECLLVSIHANAGGGSGGEVFTFPRAKRSGEYARVFGELWDVYLPEFPYRGEKEANFGILRESHCPAILVESLFMDNPADCSVMFSSEGRERIAQWIACSIEVIVDRFFTTQ